MRFQKTLIHEHGGCCVIVLELIKLQNFNQIKVEEIEMSNL